MSDSTVSEGGMAVHAFALGEIVGTVFIVAVGLVVAGWDMAAENVAGEMGVVDIVGMIIVVFEFDNFFELLYFVGFLIQEFQEIFFLFFFESDLFEKFFFHFF